MLRRPGLLLAVPSLLLAGISQASSEVVFDNSANATRSLQLSGGDGVGIEIESNTNLTIGNIQMLFGSLRDMQARFIIFDGLEPVYVNAPETFAAGPKTRFPAYLM